jgi:hypothetical protein
MPRKQDAKPEEEVAEEERTPFEDFLFHQRRALEETGKALEALLPDGFRSHGSQASKEFSKGFKVLIDAAVAEMKKATRRGDGEEGEGEEPPRASGTGKTKVKVQVD